MKRLRPIFEHLIESLLTVSGAITTLTILLVTLFLFTEGAGFFRSSSLEEGQHLYVHQQNPIRSLNAQQIKAIYDGENPVAIDLRLALSLLKVGQTLERIGDFAAGIALHVVEDGCTPHDPQLIERLHIERMFDIVLDMLHKAYQALDTEDTKLAHQVLTSDEEMNRLYHQAQRCLAEHLEQQPKGAFCALKLLLMIRKLERIGDHCSNISEEIVFYIDARVLKHQARTSSTADTKTT